MSRVLLFICLLPLSLSAREIRFGIYNVQNLFDTAHDVGKRDYRYLPRENKDRLKYCARMEETKKPTSRSVRECRNPVDWSDKKLAMKLDHIKAVFDLRGETPDVLVLSEVENANVSEQLARVLGYKSFLVSQSTDQRGIDIAFLYNEARGFEATRVFQHRARVGFGSRPIFEVEFLIKNKGAEHRLIVFANHWPSQGGKTSIPRMRAAATLKSLLEQRRRDHPEADLVALGDFNVIDYDKPHAFRDELLVPSSTGLEMKDVHALAHRRYSPGSARGSYFFKREKEWHVLDRYFVDKNLMDGKGLEVDLESYVIFGPKELSTFSAGQWIPKRYNHRATTPASAGFSDHYPVFLNFKFAN